MIGRKKKEDLKKGFRRKNISPVLADVRHPSVSSFYSPYGAQADSIKESASSRQKPHKNANKRIFSKKTLKVNAPRIADGKRFELKELDASMKRRANMRYVLPVMALLVMVSCGAALNAKRNITLITKSTFNDFQAAISAAQRYDADGVQKNLSSADEGVRDIQNQTGFLNFIPFFKQVPAFIGSIRDLNYSALDALKSADDLKKNMAVWIWGDGEKLLETLRNIKKNANQISAVGGDIRNKMATIGVADGISAGYISLQSQIFGATDLLDGAISLLQGDSYFVVFFMNDSEMRPSGGFIGSYAVVKLAEGEIQDINVNDIYYPDKFLNSKVIPPSPIQAVTADWEARDANWFFDFPTSASKVLGFMESSSVYADKNIKFKGAMAINHKVVTDILHITGPIELPEYKMVLDENNFLETVQDEVARDSDIRGGERKNVLKSLLPAMVSRIKEVSSSEKRSITDAITYRLKNKDIQIYSTDKRIENFAVKQQWAGEVYDMTDTTFGDYLAVVDANLGGEKTDAYMRQKVVLKSSIDDSGYIRNEAKITRIHGGKDADKRFYKVPNRSYVRILTPQKSQAVSATGATDKKVVPKKNYLKEGYASDQDVLAFESGTESGKQIFGYWLTVPPGEEKTLSVGYERPGVMADKFRFVYEKQSGVDSAFSYTVEAPPGYVFKETGTSEFTYNNDNPPARLIINLNLSKI